MDKIFFQYLTIFPKSIFDIWQNRLAIWQNTQYPLKKLPKTFKILSKWRNFAKSGHSESITNFTYRVTRTRASRRRSRPEIFFA